METREEHYASMMQAVQRYAPSADLEEIQKAYEYADRKHKNQLRKSGEPYIIHPLAVAEIVAEIGLDTDAIVAALLHDCLEDTDASFDEISHMFGQTVAELVEGVTKLTRVQYSTTEEQQMENLDTERRSQMDKEISIFRNALDFRDVKARECMVPRTEMRALEIGAPIEEFKQLFISSGLSKIVVYRDSVDNVVGYVHSFDFFRPVESIQDILLPVLFVPESMPVNEILKDLTQKRMSIAVVLDEYGGTSGMITVEDIIEELLGDIEDEHDKDLLLEKDLGGGQYLFSARQEVDYLNQRYDLGLPESEEYETLGGLILAHTEKIPQKDEQVEIGDFVFTIREVSSAKIETVHLRKKHAE